MFKFLRKYNKWILAVGGTLLMIVFLIPQALTQLSRGAGTLKATLATVGDSEPVTFEEFTRVQQEVQVMRDVGLQVVQLGPIQDPWHWYLLTREARQQGLIGGRLSPQDVQALQALNYRRQGLEDAITNLDGVNRMISLYQTTAQFSDRRLRAEADRLFHMVRLRPVIIEASAENVDYEPTESELEAQLRAWADVAPDDPESRFGYKLPNRVKIEWLTVSRDSVVEMIEAGDALSGTALRKHWRLNADDPNLPPMPAEPPTTVPDEVRQDLLAKLADEKLEEIERFGTSTLRTPARGLERDEGFVVLPDDWQERKVALTDLAREIADRFSVTLPSYEASGNRWLSATDLVELPGIGGAGTDEFPPQRRLLSNLAMSVRELGGTDALALLMQQDIAGPALDDADGSLYFFRVIDTEESRPPTSVDEVRDKLVEDLRRLRDYETLTASLERLESQAARRGLLSVAMEQSTVVQREQLVAIYDLNRLRLQAITGQPLEPTPSALPVIGEHEPTVRAIIDRARALPATTPVKEMTADQRVGVVPVDDQLVVVVYQLTEQFPLNEGTYQDLVKSGQLQTVLLTQELDPLETIEQTFGFDALVARHGLEIIRQDQTEDGELEPGAEEPTEAVANAGS